MKKLYCALLVACYLAGMVQAKEDTKSNSSVPAPEKKEMTLDELMEQIINLDGKVIKTTINYVANFEQLEPGKYRAMCGYWDGPSKDTWVMIPEEGKDFFQEMDKQDAPPGNAGETVCLLVRGKTLEAVGLRYRKDKGYNW